MVIATRNRRDELLSTLPKLATLDDEPPLIVVDNGSDDGTADAVEKLSCNVEVVRLHDNLGAAARNLGLALAQTPYVAFSDDDSWWAQGALGAAAVLFDRHPRLSVVAARVMVEPAGRVDPTCEEMAASPLHRAPGLPGPAVLGFIACGAIVRRSAFVLAGGFPSRFGVGGEEAPLALALAALGWQLAYVDDVVAHHQPSTGREPGVRRRRQARNDVWTAWLRLPVRGAFSATVTAAWRSRRDSDARRGIAQAVSTLPTVWHQRAVVPPLVARQWRTLGR